MEGCFFIHVTGAGSITLPGIESALNVKQSDQGMLADHMTGGTLQEEVVGIGNSQDLHMEKWKSEVVHPMVVLMTEGGLHMNVLMTEGALHLNDLMTEGEPHLNAQQSEDDLSIHARRSEADHHMIEKMYKVGPDLPALRNDLDLHMKKTKKFKVLGGMKV